MGLDKGYKPVRSSREYLSEYIPKKQEDVPKRTMRESYISAIIPLSTSVDLQDKYISFMGNVRLGRLLEDLDIFSGGIIN